MLAVAVEKRVPGFPEVPTMAEAGVDGLVVYSWQAAAAPKGLDRAVLAKLQPAIVAALADPDVKSRMEQLGFEVVGGTAEEFAVFLNAEMSHWKAVIEKGNIKP
jgi:tripartite-type tricarboxylate transporter receptor subunit TctC